MHEQEKPLQSLTKTVIRIWMNMRVPWSCRTEKISSYAHAQICGDTELIKTTDGVRTFAAERGIRQEALIEKHFETKSIEFIGSGLETYIKL
jgi:hypothetical protein